MFRIDLPRMEINADRPLLHLVDSPNPGSGIPIREEPHIGAPADRDGSPFGQFRGGYGDFQKGTTSRLDQARMTAEPRDTVAVMADRHDTGVIIESALRQDLQRPERLVRDGITGSTI